MSMPYIITENTVTIFAGKAISVHSTHPNFNKVIEAIRNSDFDLAVSLSTLENAVAQYVSGTGIISVQNGEVLYKNKPMHNAVTSRILAMMRDGFSIIPMVRFLENLMRNPSRTAIEELYLFLEGNNLPITPEGNFLAYKAVDRNYKDYHTRTFDNSIGSVCTEDRNMVDDNRQVTCSKGLHFTSLGYAKNFGQDNGHIVVLEIDPADVVSIPYDYDNQKGRCCKYKVVAHNPDKSEILTSSVMRPTNSEKLQPAQQKRDRFGRFTSNS